MANVEFSDKQSLALDYLEDNETTELFFGGGAGPGKSWLGCYWQIKNRLRYHGSRGVIGRGELKALKESTMITFFDVCAFLGLRTGVHYTYNQQEMTVTFFTGSKQVFIEMKYYPSDKDYNRFGSTEYTDGFVDEAPDVEERALEILQSRIRYKLVEFGLIPKMLVTGNPGDHWVKYRYVKTQKGVGVELQHHQKKILATIHDHLDPEFRKLVISQLEKMSTYDRARLLDGDWDAVPRTGLEYYPSYATAKHVGTEIESNGKIYRVPSIPYLPSEPVHLTYDFNVNPYMTLICTQLLWKNNLWYVRVFDEFCLPHPLNKTKYVTQAFLQKYGSHVSGIFYYGDASGKSRDTRSDTDAEHDFSRVEEVLWEKLQENSNRVVKSNPSIIARKNFLEDILKEELPIRLEIDNDCLHMKADMIHLKEGPDGKKLKEVYRDQKSGQNFQKYGHTSDALEYLIVKAFWEMFQDYLKRKY